MDNICTYWECLTFMWCWQKSSDLCQTSWHFWRWTFKCRRPQISADDRPSWILSPNSWLVLQIPCPRAWDTFLNWCYTPLSRIFQDDCQHNVGRKEPFSSIERLSITSRRFQIGKSNYLSFNSPLADRYSIFPLIMHKKEENMSKSRFVWSEKQENRKYYVSGQEIQKQK